MATLPLSVAPSGHRVAIEQIVCGVDGSERGADAVRAAIALAPVAPRLTFVAVVDAPDRPGAVVSLDERRALHALEQAQTLAAADGVHATTRFVRGDDVADALIGRAGSGALLVAGIGGNSKRARGMIDPVGQALLQRVGGPLLIARPGRWTSDARPRILVAVDDGPGATDVVRLAGAIAGATRGYVHLVHVAGRDYGGAMRRRLAELSIELIAMTAAEPVVDVLHATHVAASITHFAHRSQADLVVVGRRSITGPRAPGAVSERVVQTAPCSVLVVPAPPEA